MHVMKRSIDILKRRQRAKQPSHESLQKSISNKIETRLIKKNRDFQPNAGIKATHWNLVGFL